MIGIGISKINTNPAKMSSAVDRYSIDTNGYF